MAEHETRISNHPPETETDAPPAASPLMLLVQPPDGELERLEEKLPGWDLSEADGDALPAKVAPREAKQTSAVLVYARKDEEAAVLEMCRRLRESPAFEQVPVLVGITIYQMPLGNDVKRLPRSNFIFTPIEEDDLRKRVEALWAASA